MTIQYPVSVGPLASSVMDGIAQILLALSTIPNIKTVRAHRGKQAVPLLPGIFSVPLELYVSKQFHRNLSPINYTVLKLVTARQSKGHLGGDHCEQFTRSLRQAIAVAATNPTLFIAEASMPRSVHSST